MMEASSADVSSPTMKERPSYGSEAVSYEWAREIVEECYLGILGRPADSEGRDNFVSCLLQGDFKIRDLCNHLLLSDEMRMRMRGLRWERDVEIEADLIAAALPVLLGRHVSDDDIEHHQELLRQGSTSLSQMLQGIISGTEVQSRLGRAYFGTHDILASLYRCVYSRDVDAAALAFFGAKLDAREMTIEDVLTIMLRNEEASFRDADQQLQHDVNHNTLEDVMLARLWSLGFRFQLGALDCDQTSPVTAGMLQAFSSCFDPADPVAVVQS